MKMRSLVFFVSAAAIIFFAVGIWHKTKDPIDFQAQADRTKSEAVLQSEKATASQYFVSPEQSKSAFENNKIVEVGFVPQPEVIRQFKIIHNKVFKNEADQKFLNRVFSDSRYLLQLGDYLRDTQSAQKHEFRENQNLVIDLLVEALKSKDTSAAEQAILEVVKDSQVEDSNVSPQVRQTFAGVKAELLYQSSALKPELAIQFEQVLPGPISQKIWKNVQLQQSENLSLSRAEAKTRLAQKNH